MRTIKRCKQCDTSLDITMFPYRDGSKRLRRSWCVDCCYLKGKQWRRTRSPKQQVIIKARRKEVLNTSREFVNELKDNPCMDCGGKFPPCAMDYDHRDPSIKKHGVGTMLTSTKETILADIAKCDLVCANCHRVRTFKRG